MRLSTLVISALFLASVSESSWSSRTSHALERYELSSLTLTTVHYESSSPFESWMYIKDADGYVHRTGLGEYVGRNQGRITEIHTDFIVVVELLPLAPGYSEVRTVMRLPPGRRKFRDREEQKVPSSSCQVSGRN